MKVINIHIITPLDVLVDNEFMWLLEKHIKITKEKYGENWYIIYDYDLKRINFCPSDSCYNSKHTIVIDTFFIDESFTIDRIKEIKAETLQELKKIQKLLQLSLPDEGEQND